MSAKHILILAGGTGGHIYPAIALANTFIEHNHTVSWIGTGNDLEESVINKKNINFYSISSKGYRGKRLLSKMIFLLTFPVRLIKALLIVKQVKPDVTIGMGGYVTLFGGIISRIFRIPLVLHEQNAILGGTNKILLKLASKVCFGIPLDRNQNHSINYKITGNPIRDEYLNFNKPNSDLSNPFKLLVLGGSQGASYLNKNLPKVIEDLDHQMKFDIVHQSGANKQHEVSYEGLANVTSAKIYPYMHNPAIFYEWADIVICRAGAMTITEIMATSNLAIFIPYPHAIENHQFYNAKKLVDGGAAFLVEEGNDFKLQIQLLLSNIFKNKINIESMRRKARTMFYADANETIMNICLAEAK